MVPSDVSKETENSADPLDWVLLCCITVNVEFESIFLNLHAKISDEEV